MTSVLEVRNLNKSFDGIVVAHNINLGLQSGRVIGLIGPNGAGKTSLFNLISGVVKPDTGTVLLDGQPLDRLKFHRRVRPWSQPDLAAHPAVSVVAGARQSSDRHPRLSGRAAR